MVLQQPSYQGLFFFRPANLEEPGLKPAIYFSPLHLAPCKEIRRYIQVENADTAKLFRSTKSA